MKINCLFDAMVNVSDLKPHPKNANKHPEDQIKRLAEILKYQGWRYPVKVSKRSGFITSGHGRIEAAMVNEWAQVPVNYQDYDDEDQEVADVHADNAIASWAELDLSHINDQVKDFSPDFNLDMLGIKNFVVEPADKAKCDEDEVPEHVEPKTKPGDLYILGNHRLLCGDSTNVQHVERLMDGCMSDILFTSPPYNLGNNAKLRGYNGNGDDSAYLEKTDHKTADEYLDFLKSFTALGIINSRTSFINIQMLAGNKLVMSEYWNAFKDNLIDIMIWDKEHAQPSAARRVLNSVFEFIFIFSNEYRPSRAIKTGNDFRGTIQNIYRLNPSGKKDKLAADHGAVFPVQFAEYFISNFSNDSVLDLFGGSGSTLIACEKTNRKCFMMEIDPHYCDVIVARWEKYTGKKAELSPALGQ